MHIIRQEKGNLKTNIIHKVEQPIHVSIVGCGKSPYFVYIKLSNEIVSYVMLCIQIYLVSFK